MKKREKWRKFAGILPEQLTDHPNTEPWSSVILGLSQSPFIASSLCNKPNHLALCFKSASPGTANFSNLSSNCHPSPALPSNHHCFLVCRLLFTPPNPFPSVPLCPNPRHPALAWRVPPVLKESWLSQHEEKECQPLYFYFSHHIASPLFVWGPRFHISSHEWTLSSKKSPKKQTTYISLHVVGTETFI